MEVKVIDGGNFINSTLSFDVYGNAYLDLYDSTFQINVDRYNNPIAEKGNYGIVSSLDKINKLMLTNNNKLKNDVNKYIDDEDENEDDINYFPEYDEFIEIKSDDSDGIIYEDNINRYGKYNQRFNFSSSSSDPLVGVYERENGDITALYDTYYYKNGIMYARSSSKNDESIYTMKIYDNGCVLFRPNGDKETKYYLSTKSDKIVFNISS